VARNGQAWSASATKEFTLAYFAAINWQAFAVFSALIAIIAVFALSLSGHFPAEPKKRELKDWPGRALLVSCIIVVAFCTAKALGLAMGHLPAPIAIIGAGGSLLAAPLLLQKLPDSFIDSRGGLAALAGVAAVLAFLAGRVAA
jgi:hypothetical protein